MAKHFRLEELIGRKFGKLEIKAISPMITSDGVPGIICLCECGELVLIQLTKLLSGNVTSCGCELSVLIRSVTERLEASGELKGKRSPLFGGLDEALGNDDDDGMPPLPGDEWKYN